MNALATGLALGHFLALGAALFAIISGFQRPSDICRVIRGWHFGRYRVTQSAEARERLTELMGPVPV